jgi:hypothetical protein
MDTKRIERDLRFFKLYAGAMTLVVGVMSVAAFPARRTDAGRRGAGLASQVR